MKLHSASTQRLVPRRFSKCVWMLRLRRMLIWNVRGTSLKSTALYASLRVRRLHPARAGHLYELETIDGIVSAASRLRWFRADGGRFGSNPFLELVRKFDTSAEYHDIATANYDRSYPPEPVPIYDEILFRHGTRHQTVRPQQA